MAVVIALPVAALSGGVLPLARVVIPSVPFVPIARLGGYVLIERLRRRRVVVEPTVVVGATVAGVDIAEILLRDRGYGLTPIGFLDEGRTSADLPVPIIAHPGELTDVASRHNIRRAIVAYPAVPESRMVSTARSAADAGVDLYVLPRLFELGSAETSDGLIGYPLVRLRASPLVSRVPRTKRAFDIALSSTVLVAAAPLMAGAALAVRVFDGPPVLLRQKRIGRNGIPFELLKFRTMPVNDDADTTWSVATDVRVTRVGRILRAFSLDELPQLFNVFKGEMSLVGPRPERPYFVDRFRASIPRYDERHRAPAGITGLAQVYGLRGDTSIRHRVRLDNAYIDRWSIWSDTTILVRTLVQIVRDALRRVAAAPRSADTRGVIPAAAEDAMNAEDRAANGSGR